MVKSDERWDNNQSSRYAVCFSGLSFSAGAWLSTTGWGTGDGDGAFAISMGFSTGGALSASFSTDDTLSVGFSAGATVWADISSWD